MQEEEIVFQLLEQDRKARIERIVEERKITREDSLTLSPRFPATTYFLGLFAEEMRE